MVELKYAVVERERRWLLSRVPMNVSGEELLIRDRYLLGTRLRLRHVQLADGGVVRKLGQKVRLGEGPGEIACTSMYLDDAEWNRLVSLPAATLTKRRIRVAHGAVVVAVDEFEGGLDGLVLAEIDTGEGAPATLPADWPAIAEVTADERYTGASLAAIGMPPRRSS